MILPMICVSVQEKDFNKCKKIISGCSMVELRGDLCNFTTPQIEELVQMHSNMLYTHRIFNSSPSKAMEQVTAAIKRGVKYVDIEIEAPVDYLEYVKSYARVNGCTLIISYHNFEGTQSLQELQTIYDICRRKGADIVKIVTTAHTFSDATRVMELYKYSKTDKELVESNYMERGEESGSLSNSFGEAQARLVAFCMGDAGKFTRHLCLALGSPYTYAALDSTSATAPGQYTKAQMENLLGKENYPFRTLKLQESIFADNFQSKDTAETYTTCYKAGTATAHANEGPAVQIPCSKSIAQRAILAAAFANGTSVMENFEPCNDTMGALEVIKALGAKVAINGSTLKIESSGAESLKGMSSVFTGESGLLTRLLIPFAAYISAISGGGEIEITGHGSILKRNLGESASALQAAGATCRSNGGYLPFNVSCKDGISKHITFSGKESSQIVSGFLMMLPLLEYDTTLTVVEPASLPYIELTLRTLSNFGIEIGQKKNLPSNITYHIKGGQKYTPANIYMDSDWSSAANFAVAGALLGGVTLENMPVGSSQADENILNLLQMYGYSIKKELSGSLYNIKIGGRETCCPQEMEASLKDCPDLFPIAALLACFQPCRTTFTGVDRLAQKESNRAITVYSELSKLGFDINIDGDKMYICGNRKNCSSEMVLCCGHNDHRIAMAVYIASLMDQREILLDNIKCIDKSFPSFVERLKR